MPTDTATKERPILFTGPMVRAIIDGRKTMTRRVVDPQPPRMEDIVAKSGSTYSLYREPDATDNRPFRVCGPVWAVRDIDPELANKGLKCPYGVPGDRLWVRESFYLDLLPYSNGGSIRIKPEGADDALYYLADARGNTPWCCQLIPECCCGEVGKPRARSARFMPRWASRLTMEVTSVKVEQVQEITEEDAKAEGFEAFTVTGGYLVVTDDGGSTEIGENFIHGIPKAGDEWLNQRVAHVQHRPERQIGTAVNSFQGTWNQINGKRAGCAWADNPWCWVIAFKVLEGGPR